MALADNLIVISILGGIGAYVTNFMGFKAWADTHIIQQPLPPVTNEPPYTEPPPVTNEPQPKPVPVGNIGTQTGNTFNCVSYPRCNTVSGTDARKKCCCTNKCSLMKKSNQTMSPTMSGNMCYCNFRTTSTAPTSCTGPCPLGTRPALISGRCTCAKCTNTCTGCYDRVSNCGCKLNTSKLAYNDGNCQISCGNRTCWTNVPCGGSSKVKVCVDGNSCTTAKNAWLAKYACKSTSGGCSYTGCTSLPKGSTCFYCRCAKLCGSRGVREVKPDGSCYCKPAANLAQVWSYQSSPNEALDAGLMQVPTIA